MLAAAAPWVALLLRALSGLRAVLAALLTTLATLLLTALLLLWSATLLLLGAFEFFSLLTIHSIAPRVAVRVSLPDEETIGAMPKFRPAVVPLPPMRLNRNRIEAGRVSSAG